MANNYIADSIIGAIDTVVKGAVRDLKYDQTIEAIVTSASKAADGVYTVKSENASFEAYSSSRYYVNDTVYVMIPQGDFSKQKFITGRKVDQVSTETTFTLKLPFDDFIGLQDLTEGFNFSTEELGYIANYGNGDNTIANSKKHGSILTASESSNDKTVQSYEEVNLIGRWAQPNEEKLPVIATKMAISMDVRSLLSAYRPLRGEYGIRLAVTGDTKPTETTSSQTVTQDIYFTNKDMYGDTYAYFLATTQQKIFDISDFISLSKIEIYFWQDFNFEDEQSNDIPWRDEYQGVVPSNLFLSNFNVFFGLTTEDINEERVFLYTYDDVYYGYNPETLEDRYPLDKRELNFAWVHHDYAEEKFILINTLEKLQAYNGSIFWYQLEYDVAPPAEEAGELPWKLAPANWKYLPDYDNEFTITVQPSINKSREKYLAIVSFNGTYEKSESLVFTNIIDVESLNEALAANKNYIFKFYRPATEAEKTAYANNIDNVTLFKDQNSDNWLMEDNTIGNFLVYDENNRVIKNEDGIRFSDIEYYAMLHLRNVDADENGETETYTLLGDDTESDFTAEIKFPERFSMFTSVPYDGENDPYIRRTGKYANTICKFKINNFWNIGYNDNILSAIITRYGKTYYVNKEMAFGQSGSQGSEYTVRIGLKTGSNYALIKGEKFEIAAHVYDRTGRMLTSEDGAGKMSFTWEQISPSAIATTKTGTVDNKWTESNLNGFSRNVITGYVRNDYPPIFKVTVSGAADYPISATKGFVLTNGLFTLVQQNTISCPNRIEYKSDGSQPIYDTSVFMIEQSDGTNLYPEWRIIQLENGEVATTKYFDVAKTSYSAVTIPTNSGNATAPARDEYRLVSVLNKDENNNVIPWQWNSNMESNYYVCLWALMDDNEDIYIRQSIPLEHNVYASSLVNSWDGSLTLDKENGAVLSTMMSAGTKDNQNRFTGVLMGDWQENADSSLDIPGLYGFAKGEQTFGFKTDGTGFIGKAGKGQIQFDGNKSLISNADKNFYINLDPMEYSLEDLSNFSLTGNHYSYSPYFLYAKSPRTEDIYGTYEDLIYNYNDTDVRTSWAQPFLDDEDNDYFIVDPHNGVLTTGGVIARYGKIGEWMISKEGLYQKTELESTKQYMYLGVSSGDALEKERNYKYQYEQKKLEAHEKYTADLLAAVKSEDINIYKYDPIHYWNTRRAAKKAEDILRATLMRITPDTSSTQIRTILEDEMSKANLADFLDNYAHNHFEGGVPEVIYYDLETNEKLSVVKGENRTGEYISGQFDYLSSTKLTNTATPNSSAANVGIWAILGYKPTSYAVRRYKKVYPGGAESYEYRIQDVAFSRSTSISNTYSANTGSMPREADGIFAGIDISQDASLNSKWPDKKLSPLSDFQRNGKYYSVSIPTLKEMTYDKIVEVINALPLVYGVWNEDKQHYEGHYGLYLYQLDIQQNMALKAVPQADRDRITKEYEDALAEIEQWWRERKEEVKQQLRENKYAILAGEGDNAKENPIFYVKWNGDMFARRGLIANTWTIDDHALTYQKNSDIMYIGTESSDYDDYTPKGRAVTIDDTRKWAISASNNYDSAKPDDPYLINFGVSLSGELYAQLGTIGGWEITPTALISKKQATNADGTLKFDSNNNPVYSSIIELDTAQNALVFNGGTTIIKGDGEIFLGKLVGDVTQGRIYLANYALSGLTGDSIEGIAADLEITPGDPSKTTIEGATAEDSYDSIGDSLDFPAVTAQADTGTITTTNLTLYNINHFLITDESDSANDTSTGIMLSTGGGDETNAGLKRAVVLYPTGHDTTLLGSATLGLDTARWNVLGNYINCHDLQTDNLNITSDSLYMQGAKVATQEWVYNQLVDVYNKIKSTGSGAAAGIKSAFGGINNLSDCIAAITKIRFVTDDFGDDKGIKYNAAEGRLETPYVEFNYTDDSKGGTNAKIEGGLTEGATAITAATLNGTNIVTKKGGNALNDHLISSMEFSEPGTDGSITLTIKAITSDTEYTATFNQAGTTYYKANATKAIKVEPFLSGSIGKSMRAYGYNYNDEKLTKLFASFSLTDPQVGDSGTYSDGYVNVNYSNTTVGRVSVASVYSAGYTKGKEDGVSAVTSITNYAKSGVTYSDGGSYDVKVPASGGSVTAYAHAAGGSRKCKFNITVSTS